MSETNERVTIEAQAGNYTVPAEFKVEGPQNALLRLLKESEGLPDSDALRRYRIYLNTVYNLGESDFARKQQFQAAESFSNYINSHIEVESSIAANSNENDLAEPVAVSGEGVINTLGAELQFISNMSSGEVNLDEDTTEFLEDRIDQMVDTVSTIVAEAEIVQSPTDKSPGDSQHDPIEKIEVFAEKPVNALSRVNAAEMNLFLKNLALYDNITPEQKKKLIIAKRELEKRGADSEHIFVTRTKIRKAMHFFLTGAGV